MKKYKFEIQWCEVFTIEGNNVEEARQELFEKIRKGEINCNFFTSSVSAGEEVEEGIE